MSDETDLAENDLPQTYQSRVGTWVEACFGKDVALDRAERSRRFLEEALELVQASVMTCEEAHLLVDYVFGRECGEASKEVGGVMNTLAAFCNAHDIGMLKEAETELARCWEILPQIRAKWERKPKTGPLPGSSEPAKRERVRHLKTGGVYEVLARGVMLQTSLGMTDEETVVIYRGEDGRWWAREEAEFDDGRFALVGAPDA
ncbi:hypothetical protein [Methylobacterium aquaticum]|uniref:hypothetical protein n=1 Tax=Methylobacterium aquaticum TaxID=270351 RepID=UPI0007C81872|nr:hypothetical protein [Methylobacterium aquaticum]